MTGIEMLEQARTHAPGAKYLLLTAYADTDVAIKAINDIGLDYYLLKPWDPPEERLFPVIDDLLGDWRQANPDHTSEVRVVGYRWSDRSHDIKMFLAGNYVPYRWYDVDRDAEAQRLRDLAQAMPADLPLVLVPDGDALRSPSTLELAGALGLRTTARQRLYDVCIVGGGPRVRGLLHDQGRRQRHRPGPGHRTASSWSATVARSPSTPGQVRRCCESASPSGRQCPRANGQLTAPPQWDPIRGAPQPGKTGCGRDTRLYS